MVIIWLLVKGCCDRAVNGPSLYLDPAQMRQRNWKNEMMRHLILCNSCSLFSRTFYKLMPSNRCQRLQQRSHVLGVVFWCSRCGCGENPPNSRTPVLKVRKSRCKQRKEVSRSASSIILNYSTCMIWYTKNVGTSPDRNATLSNWPGMTDRCPPPHWNSLPKHTPVTAPTHSHSNTNQP